jgi:hypothetical protein
MATMSRGLRNLNPGNIRRGGVRYKGERAQISDSAFRQFEAIEWGYRAMFVVLHTYAVKHNCHTLREMIGRYAPPCENHTESYIRRVSDATHLEADEPICTTDGAVMTAIVAAMSEVENGVAANMRDIWHGWELFIADFGPK